MIRSILTILFASAMSASALEIHAVSGKAEGDLPKLVGPDATLQIVVSEGQRDLTRNVQYSIEPANVVTIDATGLVKPVADGIATLSATIDGLSGATIRLKVEQSGTPQPINFPNEVVPILTKHGCNGGGCHGKSEGQNGFRLSLLGFTPEEDYGTSCMRRVGVGSFQLHPSTVCCCSKGPGRCRMVAAA